MLFGIIFFIVGSLVGSFLNVCIYRLPRGKSIIKPRSHCVHCNHPIKWYENIPLLSFMILKGRCSYCHKRISFVYFVVELLTALLFLLLYIKLSLNLFFLFTVLLGCGLIVATFVDFEHQLIPDTVSLGLLCFGLVGSYLYPPLQGLKSHIHSFVSSFIGALVGGGSIYILGLFGKLVFRKEAMGFGDVKFMAMIGSFLGWKKVLLVFFLAPFFGAPIGIVQKILYKKELMPYAPYLSIATFVVILWGDQILRAIFTGMIFGVW